jgi:hypothetical protein
LSSYIGGCPLGFSILILEIFLGSVSVGGHVIFPPRKHNLNCI